MPLLETRKLTAFYGDFQALYGIDTTPGNRRDHRHHRRERGREVDLPERRSPASFRARPAAFCSTVADRRAACG